MLWSSVEGIFSFFFKGCLFQVFLSSIGKEFQSLTPSNVRKLFFEIFKTRGQRETKIGRLSLIIAMLFTSFDKFLLKKVTMIFLVNLKHKFPCFEFVKIF